MAFQAYVKTGVIAINYFDYDKADNFNMCQKSLAIILTVCVFL